MEKSKAINKVKIVIVGDEAVGKSCLISAYGMNKFPTENIPSVFDTYEGPCEYEGKEVVLKI
jgi:small GTP-binding protein